MPLVWNALATGLALPMHYLHPPAPGAARDLASGLGFYQRHLAVEIRGEDLRRAERDNGVHHAGAEFVLPLDGAGLGVEGEEQIVLGAIEDDAILLDEHGGVDVVAEPGVEFPDLLGVRGGGGEGVEEIVHRPDVEAGLILRQADGFAHDVSAGPPDLLAGPGVKGGHLAVGGDDKYLAIRGDGPAGGGREQRAGFVAFPFPDELAGFRIERIEILVPGAEEDFAVIDQGLGMSEASQADRKST